jgi:hypothetical protein
MLKKINLFVDKEKGNYGEKEIFIKYFYLVFMF